MVPATPPRRKRPRAPLRAGRPHSGLDPEARARDIAVAARFWQGEPARTIAADYRVARRTVYKWAERALTYSGPEAAALRRLAGR